MKKTILFLAAIFVYNLAMAQPFHVLGMKVKKLGLTGSFDKDMIRNIDADYFMSISKDGTHEDFSDIDFRKQDIASMFCENPAIRAELTLLPFARNENFQLNTGLSLMFNRADGSYYNFYYGEQAPNYNNINFSSYSQEVALDLSFLYHKRVSFLHLYGGVGTNLGLTFAGNMNIDGQYQRTSEVVGGADDDPTFVTETNIPFSESHNMKDMLHQRVFLQGAATVIFFKRLEVGFEGRLGKGYRATGGAHANTTLNSWGVVTKWNFK